MAVSYLLSVWGSSLSALSYTGCGTSGEVWKCGVFYFESRVVSVRTVLELNIRFLRRSGLHRRTVPGHASIGADFWTVQTSKTTTELSRMDSILQVSVSEEGLACGPRRFCLMDGILQEVFARRLSLRSQIYEGFWRPPLLELWDVWTPCSYPESWFIGWNSLSGGIITQKVSSTRNALHTYSGIQPFSQPHKRKKNKEGCPLRYSLPAPIGSGGGSARPGKHMTKGFECKGKPL